jgi:hypothetical protein
LEKRVVTPLFSSECTRLSAPFIQPDSPRHVPGVMNQPERASSCTRFVAS